MFFYDLALTCFSLACLCFAALCVLAVFFTLKRVVPILDLFSKLMKPPEIIVDKEEISIHPKMVEIETPPVSGEPKNEPVVLTDNAEQQAWARDDEAYFKIFGKHRKLTKSLLADIRRRVRNAEGDAS